MSIVQLGPLYPRSQVHLYASVKSVHFPVNMKIQAQEYILLSKTEILKTRLITQFMRNNEHMP